MVPIIHLKGNIYCYTTIKVPIINLRVISKKVPFIYLRGETFVTKDNAIFVFLHQKRTLIFLNEKHSMQD